MVYKGKEIKSKRFYNKLYFSTSALLESGLHDIDSQSNGLRSLAKFFGRQSI
jgi:hypothetical protein